MKKKDMFDKKKEYEEEIKPLINQVMIKCMSYNIPMYATFAVTNSDAGTVYQSHLYHSTVGTELKEDLFNTLLLSINGFEDDLPEDIKTHIRSIQQYLEQQEMNVTAEKMKKKVELKEDKIAVAEKVVRERRKTKLNTSKKTKKKDDDTASTLIMED